MDYSLDMMQLNFNSLNREELPLKLYLVQNRYCILKLPLFIPCLIWIQPTKNSNTKIKQINK
jgi:hypothetical protein